MAMLTRSSKSSTYFSRLIVSLYLRPLVGRREIRKILQCADYRRAKVCGAAREAHLAQLFAKLRRSHSHMTTSQIDALVQHYLTTTLELFEAERLEKPATTDEEDEGIHQLHPGSFLRYMQAVMFCAVLVFTFTYFLQLLI